MKINSHCKHKYSCRHHTGLRRCKSKNNLASSSIPGLQFLNLGSFVNKSMGFCGFFFLTELEEGYIPR